MVSYYKDDEDYRRCNDPVITTVILPSAANSITVD